MLRAPTWTTVGLALLAALARLPWLHQTLSPDEGGFLMVGGQWSPGHSLYGDYWVDRPPLLIGLFGLAAWLGGATALRLMGMAAVAAAVLLAGLLGRHAAPQHRWAGPLAAATAGVFLSTPYFGVREVDGELLAAPFVLGGLLAVVVATRLREQERGSRALVAWALAGALGVAALAVKQSMADVAVAIAAALAWQLRARRLRATAYDALAAAGAAVLTLALLLGWAAWHGTTPAGLWDAVVGFRARASVVLGEENPAAMRERARALRHAFVASGAVLVLLVPLLPAPRARVRGCLPVVAAAVCAWEAVGIVAGGSYWWHYLIGLVPGLVLVAVAVVRHRRLLVLPLALALAGGVVGAVDGTVTLGDSAELAQNQRLADYLVRHVGPGDTGIVAYGNPAALQVAGLRSPYENLWSLPVRVRDPQLRALTRVLEGPDRPTWVLLSGPSLASWGIDAATAQPVLDRRYRLVQVVGDWRVLHILAP